MSYVLSLEIGEGLDLIELAYKKTQDDLLFQRWLHGPQFEMSLDEFKHSLMPQVEKKTEDILETVEAIIKRDGKGWLQ